MSPIREKVGGEIMTMRLFKRLNTVADLQKRPHVNPAIGSMHFESMLDSQRGLSFLNIRQDMSV